MTKAKKNHQEEEKGRKKKKGNIGLMLLATTTTGRRDEHKRTDVRLFAMLSRVDDGNQVGANVIIVPAKYGQSRANTQGK